jgi:hypothetical protein
MAGNIAWESWEIQHPPQRAPNSRILDLSSSEFPTLWSDLGQPSRKKFLNFYPGLARTSPVLAENGGKFFRLFPDSQGTGQNSEIRGILPHSTFNPEPHWRFLNPELRTRNLLSVELI